MRKKIIFFTGAICLFMAFYCGIIGASSTSAASKSLYDTSKIIVSGWKNITQELEIERGLVEKGDLSIIPKEFSALDLIVYGSEIVTHEYREIYSKFNLPRLVDRVVISNVSGEILYSVSGARLLALKHDEDGYGVVLFSNVSFHVINELNHQFDGHNLPLNAQGDGEGIIQFSTDKNLGHVMAIFIPYKV